MLPRRKLEVHTKLAKGIKCSAHITDRKSEPCNFFYIYVQKKTTNNYVFLTNLVMLHYCSGLSFCGHFARNNFRIINRLFLISYQKFYSKICFYFLFLFTESCCPSFCVIILSTSLSLYLVGRQK